jgi:hypothetical protein
LADAEPGGPEALFPQRLGSGFQGDNDEAALVLEEEFPDIADSMLLMTPSPLERSLAPDNGNAVNAGQTRRLFGLENNGAPGAIGAQMPIRTGDSNLLSPLSAHQADEPGSARKSLAANAMEPLPGAMAANGGWFADAMVSALAKY